MFEQFFTDTRADGALSHVVIVRSDRGGKFSGGEFGDLCRSVCNMQEFTPADSPQFNGVAERAIGLIETSNSMGSRARARFD